jgi:hypothetical protein
MLIPDFLKSFAKPYVLTMVTLYISPHQSQRATVEQKLRANMWHEYKENL